MTTAFAISKSKLKLLAMIVWLTGVIALSVKSFMLMNSAFTINPDEINLIVAIAIGFIIGIIKTKYLFIGLCRKNLARIEAIKTPKIWQFYRPHFFVFLSSMIFLGSYLSEQAQGNYSMLIIMSVIELSIATALLGSSYCYWNKTGIDKIF